MGGRGASSNGASNGGAGGGGNNTIDIADGVKQKKLINDLANEYDTRLKKVTKGAEKAAGDVDITGATMRLNTSDEATAYHEFAHTLANTDADKYGLTDTKDFFKELKKIHRKYLKEVGADTSRWISSYEHASRDVNEFLAESFAQNKIIKSGKELPSKYTKDTTYTDQVMEVVDKYFKKK